ncbi:MAG: nucleoside kinase [Epulopiscium sp.]|nr:nucleoside kinase [Candidatus Epulonipiscium sp.]
MNKSKDQIQVKFPDGEKRLYPKGICLLEVSKDFQGTRSIPILAAVVNNKLMELRQTLKEDANIRWIDFTHKDGFRIYQRSLSFVLILAAQEVLEDQGITKVRINHAVNNGYFCEIEGVPKVTEDMLIAIEKRMREIVKEDLSFQKETVSLDVARDIFKEYKMYDKQQLFKYRRASNVNLYQLSWLKNYFYGYMAPSTGYLKTFRLIPYSPRFILQFPSKEDPSVLPPSVPHEKLSAIFMESEKWGRIMEVETVGALNNILSMGGGGDLIRVSEALQEKKIANIADQILERKDKIKVILIAGPSSSGKTTFAQRLSIQLRVNGMNPHPISIDDYFVDRHLTPLDEEGNPDFEGIEAIDLDLFNKDLKALLDGEFVSIPNYNFMTGSREYGRSPLKIGENDVLVVEGIHGLNDALTKDIPKENKYKIYISALTQLNLDDHNRISTTDTRLLRRIVRDNQYRGMRASQTIEMWPSVRRGEEKNIFPFQEEADIMFNSALVYELGILKQYAEPLLFQIEPQDPGFAEAKRLIKFLDYFLGVSSEEVPKNSIIREFIGGSCFH